MYMLFNWIFDKQKKKALLATKETYHGIGTRQGARAKADKENKVQCYMEIQLMPLEGSKQDDD